MCARATSTSSYDNSTKVPSAQDCAETWAPEHVPEKRLNFLVMSTYWLQYYPGENWKPETRTEKKEADFCYLEVCLHIKKVPIMTVRIRKLMIMPTQGSQEWHDAIQSWMQRPEHLVSPTKTSLQHSSPSQFFQSSFANQETLRHVFVLTSELCKSCTCRATQDTVTLDLFLSANLRLIPLAEMDLGLAQQNNSRAMLL